MKPISELGLELIELANQFLLVEDENSRTVHNHAVLKMLHTCKDKIIASTKPLEGLPLLVIEDEAESEYYKTHAKAGFGDYDDFPTFKEGYDKAKEIYKFTEQDLRRAMDYASQITNNRLKYIDDYIQSLTKKELWIEVEGYKVNGMMDEATSYRPKIENNQIKGIYI